MIFRILIIPQSHESQFRQRIERPCPDPFAWGISLLAALFSGAAYLEIRRQNRLASDERAGEFRRTWFSARRTVIHARRVVEEFATYVEELGFGSDEFMYGRKRLDLSRETVRDIRRLYANCLMNATHLADDLDDLSEFLDSSYSPIIKRIQDQLTESQMPHTYDAIIVLVKDGVSLYEELLRIVSEQEGF